MNADVAEGNLLGDRYRIGAFLGFGATSEVYAAVDTRLDRPVAVKFLRADLAADPAHRRRFSTEARTAARLCHPNVVAVYDTADPAPPGRPYIVMEFLAGPTLRAALAAGPLPETVARDIALQVLAALDAAGRIGLVHRDIKPDNIVATSDGRWKVADFGTAGCLDPATGADRLPAAEPVVGTPAYLAPERVQGCAATAASDMFSLGVVLFEALAGCRPYEALGSPPWTDAASGRPAVPLGDLRPDVDPAFAAAVDRAVDADPGRRFARPADMGAALVGGRSRADRLMAAPAPVLAAVRSDHPDDGPDTMAVRVIAGRMAVPVRTFATALRLAVGGGLAVAVALTVAFVVPGRPAGPAHAGTTVAAPGGPGGTAPAAGPSGTSLAVASPPTTGPAATGPAATGLAVTAATTSAPPAPVATTAGPVPPGHTPLAAGGPAGRSSRLPGPGPAGGPGGGHLPGAAHGPGHPH